jgi:hypothetical protein
MAKKPLAEAGHTCIVVPPLPTQAQIQQMLQRASERDEFIHREVIRASGPGSARSLSEFFDAFYYANASKAVMIYRPDGTNRDIDSQIWRNLRKAIIRTMHGPYAPAMHAAAQAWEIHPETPRAPLYARLQATMLIANPPPLTGSQITRAVTSIRKDLEAWLRKQYPQTCPKDVGAIRKQERLARREHKFQQQAAKRQQRFARQERRMLARMDIAWHKARNS